jgi:uncharacterized cupredoxin-like copper-binding protein
VARDRASLAALAITNKGKLAHDAFIGDAAAQAEHEKEMRAAESGGHGGHEHGVGSTDAITVPPGKTGELTHTFDKAGTVEIGCHQAGHYAVGMKVTVTGHMTARTDLRIIYGPDTRSRSTDPLRRL